MSFVKENFLREKVQQSVCSDSACYSIKCTHTVLCTSLLHSRWLGSDYIFFSNITQVFIPTVKLLTDKQLKELGIETKGDMALLRRQCHESEQSKYSMMYFILMEQCGCDLPIKVRSCMINYKIYLQSQYACSNYTHTSYYGNRYACIYTSNRMWNLMNNQHHHGSIYRIFNVTSFHFQFSIIIMYICYRRRISLPYSRTSSCMMYCTSGRHFQILLVKAWKS